MNDSEKLDEVEYFTDVAKIRYVIASLMRKHNLIDRVKLPNGELNSFHMRVQPNKQAVFGVEFIDDVIPDCIYTPYGALEINCRDHFRNLSSAYLTTEEKCAFLSELRKTLPMVELQSYEADMRGTRMLQPAIYGITRLPWKKDVVFNQPLQEVPPSFNNGIKQQTAERQHVAEVFNQVNVGLQAAGYPEASLTIAEQKMVTPEPIMEM